MAERSEWRVDRGEATARGGMVAAKTGEAAETGAEVLRRGGNAVDAAVTSALVATVVEPWMNGLGGGGYLVRHDPRRDESVVVEYPMVAPAGATADMFPLSGAGNDAALFGWPAVVDNANIVGHRSVAVPGTVAGLALALVRYGTISWAEALAPAIAYAEDGFPVTWHTTLWIGRDLGNLSRFPATRAIFCDANGNPPVSVDESKPVRLRQSDLAKTLRTLADQGSGVFYEGPLAAAMVDHLADHGAPVERADFALYRPAISPALRCGYHGHEIVTVGGGTGGPTLAQSMRILDGTEVGRLDHNSPAALHLMTEAFRLAFADRYAYLADPDAIAVPLAALLSDDYLTERRAAIRRDRTGPVAAGDRRRLGVTHTLAVSMPEYARGGSTTHLSVVDKDGVAVALTQTLLSGWGSRVIVPGTGVLLNNGLMWFDPEPGRPNSIAGGKRPLSNMAPAIVTRDGRSVAALGASGGRRILNCVAQLAMNLIDHGLTMQPAVSAPRIDASTPDLLVNSRLPAATRQALAAMDHQIRLSDERLFFGDFASPACVAVAADGTYRGGVDPYYFTATAVGVTA